MGNLFRHIILIVRQYLKYRRERRNTKRLARLDKVRDDYVKAASKIAKEVIEKTREETRLLKKQSQDEVDEARKAAEDADIHRENVQIEYESELRTTREQFRQELAERDSKIRLLELELSGLVAINTRYSQCIERDLAILSRQIEEAKTSERLPPTFVS